MKKTRIAKTLTAAALSAAMVMSMGGMTAFAADVPVQFTTKLNVDADASVPAVSFQYNIAPCEADDINTGETVEIGRPGLKISNVVFNHNSELDGNAVTGTATVEVEDPEKTVSDVFAQPGIYRYVITESIDNQNVFKQDITSNEDSNTKYLDIFVKTVGEGREIYHSRMFNNKSDVVAEDPQKDDTFESTYATNELVLTKHVTGDMGDTSRLFTFDVTVTAPVNTTVKYTKVGESETTYTFTGTGAETAVTHTFEDVQLSDSQSFTIKGIPTNATFGVAEDDINEGYNTSYVVNDNWEVPGKLTSGLFFETEDIEKKTEANTVDFVNNRTIEEIPPVTGIILNFAPYILLVAFAGVFAVLFLRKRREEF